MTVGITVAYESVIVYLQLQQEERLAAAVGGLVPLSTVIQETIEYTKQRQAFGKPLIDNQVRFRNQI
jgi:citronellyl-CoA dehydrogenase